MNPLELMLSELESHRLEVILTPQRIHTNEGGMVRTVAGSNCPWYRRLCAGNASGRGVRRGKFDTVIRRENIRRVLSRLVDGKESRSKYAFQLLSISEKFEISRKFDSRTTIKIYGKA